MRDTLLAVLVGGLCLLALFRPRTAIYSYVWFSLFQPDVLAFSYGQNHYSMTLAIVTLLVSISRLGRLRCWFVSPIVVGLILLTTWAGLSVSFAVNPSLAIDPFLMFFRMVTVVLMIPLWLETVEHLAAMLTLMGLSLGFIGLKFAIYGVLHGGLRYDSGFGGYYGDNNTLAAGLTMALPLLYYGWQMTTQLWLRLGLVISLFGSLVTIVFTHSRGGAVATGVVLLLILLRVRRRLSTLLLVFLMVAPALYFAGSSYVERLRTISDPYEESSARSRLNSYSAAIAMAQDYPVTGVGFGSLNQRALWHRYLNTEVVSYAQVVHNTYLQILVDCGIPAFSIYAVMLFGTILWLRRSAATHRRVGSPAYIYPAAIELSLVGFAVATMFLSQVMVDMPYMLLMCASAWFNCQRELSLTVEPELSLRPATS